MRLIAAMILIPLLLSACANTGLRSLRSSSSVFPENMGPAMTSIVPPTGWGGCLSYAVMVPQFYDGLGPSGPVGFP